MNKLWASVLNVDNQIAWRFRDADEPVGSTQAEQNVSFNAVANGRCINNTDYGDPQHTHYHAYDYSDILVPDAQIISIFD